MVHVVFLWHMHQPFYKDLVTGEYRLPWVRMHALKDYFGMVRLLDEFPDVHVTFNLVPSLITQLQDYVAETASDPFLDVALKQASDLTQEERRFALQYLFQANHTHLIGRYPRLLELYEKYRTYNQNAAIAERHFTSREIADLQVLSQLCWFDEFFLKDPEVQTLVAKGRDYARADQQLVGRKQREIMGAVLPAYRSAADRGGIEVSTSPFYHPILPLLCDTDAGATSRPGLPLPHRRFRHPEDAREHLRRGLDLHQQLFGKRPQGVWPSEGSVSEEVLAIAHELGVRWMATDEGVLGRTMGVNFARDSEGTLPPASAEQLYRAYCYKKDAAEMRLLFRDHALSDLIGFVYSGMPAADAVKHFISRVKASAKSIVAAGRTAVVAVVLDGENAWEFFPESGREFLRRLYAGIQSDPELQGTTVSEAIALNTPTEGQLRSLVPGSWINSNFNVWIGSPEDNLAWEYLAEARELYEQKAEAVSAEQRKLAYEELLIAEGSDWNWWYGPEHSTANDREFDELYRKHLSNIYQALGETPPDHLAQPIIRGQRGAEFTPQSAYIRPTLDGNSIGYFDWIGAARYRVDTHGSSMHGKRFLLETGYVGMDEKDLYCRLDFAGDLFSEDENGEESLSGTFDVVQSIECIGADGAHKGERIRLVVKAVNGKRQSWQLDAGDVAERPASPEVIVHLGKVLETRIALDFLNVRIGDTIAVRFSVWENNLPVDSLPHEGAIQISVQSEEQLSAVTAGERWKV